ncbi:uncharacterized protein DUF4136 [Novosphingobium sp. PhB57]|uniref:DUF4136 domain-containing protein n=1 Tax=unclassified Novosphingobium TaxID=2644732 RepID=UPI00104B6EA0|nr:MULTISPECIES: DUF4136 domain-containing protein [unclassified Novosphingobium]TCU61916.1 uncharacterized protein DUF4136 [Novosphingobium sp. PhB57]TDW68984.1 uncharacterized protein DUF4136 [Novosphingobium sp. PhB55]
MNSRALTLACCALLTASCATTPKVTFDADPTANFAGFRTYSWAYTAAPQGVNPLLTQRVKTAVESEMSKRGYTQAGTGDFAIGFTLGSRDRVEVSSLGSYGPYFRPWGGWAGYNQVDVRNVTDGTLTIDVYDSASKSPVWHGTATQQVTSSSVTQEKVNAVVTAVLANFPPPAGAAK